VILPSTKQISFTSSVILRYDIKKYLSSPPVTAGLSVLYTCIYSHVYQPKQRTTAVIMHISCMFLPWTQHLCCISNSGYICITGCSDSRPGWTLFDKIKDFTRTFTHAGSQPFSQTYSTAVLACETALQHQVSKYTAASGKNSLQYSMHNFKKFKSQVTSVVRKLNFSTFRSKRLSSVLIYKIMQWPELVQTRLKWVNRIRCQHTIR